MKKYVYFVLLAAIVGCVKQSPTGKLKTTYLKEGELVSEEIDLDFIDGQGNINSPYLDTVIFTQIDSITFKDHDPDKDVYHAKDLPLNFKNGNIEMHSPEYYTLFTVHHLNKAINYYSNLFHKRIDFNSQKSYRKINVAFGDVPLMMTPKYFIYSPPSNPSPSVIYHEIGHRAFWYLEDSLKIKFGGLTYIHVGLLEYFSASLNNSPLVGEDVLPPLLQRNLSHLVYYPLHDTLKLGYTFKLLEKECPKIQTNPHSNIARFYNAFITKYGSYLEKKIDNHRGGLAISHPLWMIRKEIGQEKMDPLVANTILNLNSFMDQRESFYQKEADEALADRIDWFDVVYGLLQTDQKQNQGANKKFILKVFKEKGFPVDRIL